MCFAPFKGYKRWSREWMNGMLRLKCYLLTYLLFPTHNPVSGYKRSSSRRNLLMITQTILAIRNKEWEKERKRDILSLNYYYIFKYVLYVIEWSRGVHHYLLKYNFRKTNSMVETDCLWHPFLDIINNQIYRDPIMVKTVS